MKSAGKVVTKPIDRQILKDAWGYSEVKLNTGTYAIVEVKSPVDTKKLKQVSGKCPAGMKAISAGVLAGSSRGEPDDFRVAGSSVHEDGTGWTYFGNFDGTNATTNGVGNYPAPYE